MKKTIQESFTILIANRYLFSLCIAILLITIGFITYIGLNVRPSELQLVSHKSDFGITHFYRDQWFYLLNFGVFGLFAAVMHVILSVKLYIIKGNQLAVLFAWLGIVIIILAWVTAWAVLDVTFGLHQ